MIATTTDGFFRHLDAFGRYEMRVPPNADVRVTQLQVQDAVFLQGDSGQGNVFPQRDIQGAGRIQHFDAQFLYFCIAVHTVPDVG